MPKKGVVVTFKESAYNRMREEYEKHAKGRLTFTTWLTNYILDKLEEDELLRVYAPALEFIGISDTDGTIFVRDHFIDRIVEIETHDQGIGKRFLYCRYCERDDCLHVGFCFAIKEVNKVMVKRGFRMPKVRRKKDTDEEEEEDQ